MMNISVSILTTHGANTTHAADAVAQLNARIVAASVGNLARCWNNDTNNAVIRATRVESSIIKVDENASVAERSKCSHPTREAIMLVCNQIASEFMTTLFRKMPVGLQANLDKNSVSTVTDSVRNGVRLQAHFLAIDVKERSEYQPAWSATRY